ncbi:sterol desaturase family protein [Methylosoma difficile]
MEILQQLQQNLPTFAVDIIRLFIWLILLIIIFVPLEFLFKQQSKKVFRKGFFTDLVYYFISSLLPVRVLIVPMTALAWGLHAIVPSELQQWTAGLPLGERLLAAMVVGEIGSYWGHRWMHEWPWLWRFHAIHHSAEQLDWLVNTRAHPMDIIFTRLCGFIPMYVFGFTQLSRNTTDMVPLFIIMIGTVWGFFIHANLRWRFGSLEWLISTPAFHHWHHTNDNHQVINKNYAAMFPWIDYLFGTFYLPSKQWPVKYGIDEAISANLLKQLLQPFLFLKKR